MTVVRWPGNNPRSDGFCLALFACPDERSGTRGLLLGLCQKELAEGILKALLNNACFNQKEFSFNR
jgi:hypothetical protein